MKIMGEDTGFALTGKETVFCQHEGEDRVLSFNGKFLRELLEKIPSNEVTFEFSERLKPVIFYPFEKNASNSDILPFAYAIESSKN